MTAADCPFVKPRTGYEPPDVRYHDATVDGHWTRVRVHGRDFGTAAGIAAARSVGRRPSAVVSVRNDGYRPGVNCYSVTVATGPRRHGVTPVVTVSVNLEVSP